MRTIVHLPYRFIPLALDQQLTPRSAWTVLTGAISSEGRAVEAQCAPLLSFLRAAAVEGSALPSEDMAPVSTVHADRGVSCWSRARGMKR